LEGFVTSYAKDIFPLFTDKDVRGMAKAIDLRSFDEVKAWSKQILDRIRGIGGPVMPPPPSRGEGPWSQANIDLFEAWVKEGCPP
jgi:hypothetical protein